MPRPYEDETLDLARFACENITSPTQEEIRELAEEIWVVIGVWLDSKPPERRT